MKETGDESNLAAHVAGIMAMISALIKSLPAANRKRLSRQLEAEFEALLAAMSSGASHAEREGVQWMRDLFLRRIAEADSKPVTAKRSKAPRGDAKPPAKGVDFEL